MRSARHVREKSEHSLVEYVLSLLCLPSDMHDEGSAANQTAVLFKEFLDEIPGGFFIYRADDKEELLYANAAVCRIFGCETMTEFRALTGNTFRGMVHRDDYDAVEKSIYEQIEASRYDLDYVEYRIVRRDGAVRHVEDYGHYLCSQTYGGVFYVFVSDATEKIARRKEEEEAREAHYKSQIEAYDFERNLIRREYLRRLEVIEGLSVNYDSILYADLDDNTLTPYRVGTRTAGMFDGDAPRTYVAFIAEYATLWVRESDREKVRAALDPEVMRARLKTSKTYYVRYCVVQDGEERHMLLRIVNVGKAGTSSQAVIGCQNVDDEVRQEIAQRQTLEDALRDATRAEAAKNTFLSAVSHNMRTPLNAIFGYAELAKRAGDRNEACKNIGKIEDAGRTLLDQIDKVLAMTYTSANGGDATTATCRLSALIDDVRKKAAVRAAEKGLALRVECDVTHDEVYVDSARLKLVLDQLVGNALQFTTEGEVGLTVRETERSDSGLNTYVFTVRDTGIGIAADALERIFKPFEREKDATIDGSFGAGLGLTIAKNAVETLEGTIAVESAPNKGSTFTVTLALAAARDAVRPSSAVADLDGARILLVEDNEINRELETEILTDLGFEVDTAVNGSEAVEKIKAAGAGRYAFVLMDLQMPVMNGYEAARAIRALDDPAVRNVPIVALSANAFDSDKRKSKAAGIDEHLSKPMDVAALLETVRRLVASREQEKKR